MVPPSKKTVFGMIVFLASAASLTLGIFIGVKLEDAREERSFHEVREGGYRFVNPLLECESSSDFSLNKELLPFQYKVKSLIERIVADHKAEEVSVYYRDLNNGQWFGINDDEKFAPASLLKVPIMIAYLKWAETEPGVLQQRIHYDGKNDRTAIQNIKPLHTLEPGKSYTIDDLLFRMIAYSDNNADRLLIENLPPERGLLVFHDLDVDFDPADTRNNIMSVASYASFFRVLYNASYLNKTMSEKALNYLAYIDFKEGMVAGVPQDIAVASKYGERIFVRPNSGNAVKQLHEVGIIYCPNRPILLGIMTRGQDFMQQANVIRDITRLVYDEINGQARASLRR